MNHFTILFPKLFKFCTCMWVFNLMLSLNAMGGTPTIISISPATGPVGTLITIQGTNLLDVKEVTIGSNVQSLVINNSSSTVLKVMVMPGSLSGKLWIATVSGSAVAPTDFTITYGFPASETETKITQFNPGNSGATFGTSVAITADGNTALIGAPKDGSGTAGIYVRIGNTWTFSKYLTAPNIIGAALYGSAVSISADGSIAAIAGPADNNGAGAAWTFRNTSNGWIFDSKIVNAGSLQFGNSLSLSGDGNKLLIGSPQDLGGKGSAYLYNYSGNGWMQPVNLQSMQPGSIKFGYAVALSADGFTALIGSPGDNGGYGSATVFVNGSQQAVLVENGSATPCAQGTSVAISADGSTALIGAPNWNGVGTAIVFALDGNWKSQTHLDLNKGGQLGTAVALSAAGDRALVAMPFSGNGKTDYYYRSNDFPGKWKFYKSVIGANASIFAKVGSALAMSADGKAFLMGGAQDNNNNGAVWAEGSSDKTIVNLVNYQKPVGDLISVNGFFLDGLVSATINKIPALNVGIDLFNTKLSLMIMPGSTSGPVILSYPQGDVYLNYYQLHPAGSFIQVGSKLVGVNPFAQSLQGSSVAVSADDLTAIVGGPGDGASEKEVGHGGVWIYDRYSDYTWNTGTKIEGPAGSSFGTSVSISADGNTALVGAPRFSNGLGAAFILTKSNGNWSNVATLTPNKVLPGDKVGNSVSLSADGSIAVLSGGGGAWVFTRGMGGWVSQNNDYTLCNSAFSVAISADSKTIAVRDWNVIRIFNATPDPQNPWVQKQYINFNSPYIDGVNAPVNIAITANGNMVATGIPTNTTSSASGIVLVYFSDGLGNWNTIPRIVFEKPNANEEFAQGTSVALSADGNRLLIGGPLTNLSGIVNKVGATWAYSLDPGSQTYTLINKFVGKLIAANQINAVTLEGPEQGTSVAISATGITAIAGGPEDDGKIGAAFPFVQGFGKGDLPAPTNPFSAFTSSGSAAIIPYETSEDYVIADGGSTTISVESFIYPNPASREITVQGKYDNTDVVIFDSMGAPILKTIISGENPVIDISSLRIGEYTIRVVDRSAIFLKN